MRRTAFCLMVTVLVCCLGAQRTLRYAPASTPERHRSPIDIVVLPGGQLALTANHTSDSVSLVDLRTGKLIAEQACGRRPAGVACSRDGRRAAVSNSWSGTLTFLQVTHNGLQPTATVPVGSQPRGVVFAANGESIYVALSGADEVVELAWPSSRVLQRWPAPREPRRLAMTRDGRFLAAVCSRSGTVRCWDTRDKKEVRNQRIAEAFNLLDIAFDAADRELVVPHCHDRERAINRTNISEGWALDNRLSRLPLEPDRQTEYWQIALDVRGEAVGDPCALAFSTNGKWLAMAAGGTHELLLLQTTAIPWVDGEPGDHINPVLEREDGKLRRVPLGGRPVAVRFVDDTETAVVANYLLDSVQVIDAKAGKVVRTIPLGGPSQPSLGRQGEAIFYDAARSHHQWFSCHTCHTEGHTSGRCFDTLNDLSFGNPKLTPTLRGVVRTGPWTWHGWQTDLSQTVEKSLTDTLYGSKPTAVDVQAVVAFLQTLDHPPNPNRKMDGSLTPAAERGRELFYGKAHCAHCHQGEHYTSPKNYDVKIEGDLSDFELWNPPSLRGLRDRGPYLHDGRAETLDDLLRGAHRPERLGGQALSDQERCDLIEFLKSL